MIYRTWHLLAQISERGWSQAAFAGCVAAGAIIVQIGLRHAFTHMPTLRQFTAIAAVGLFVFLLTFIELRAIHERRHRVVRDMKTVAELNHHVRNALQAIQYAAHSSTDRSQVQVISESVDRIDRILRELYPVLGESNKIAPSQPRARSSKLA